ncbi:MAG TPA: glycosyl hydrolase [Gemmatimonadaceae bacterium]|nr:glycosyl hydrolase [Gemmatimonadaceae bacterium]
MMPAPVRHPRRSSAGVVPATLLAAALTMVFAVAPSLAAQRTQPRPASDSGAREPAAFFAGMHWRDIGPARGGRSVAVAGSSKRPLEYYMGTTGGGVFKTTDGGATWAPVTDKYFGGTIGAIAVSESNPDIVYVGTGEYPIRGNVSHGDGVWKSTDAGRTWTHVGLENTRQISRVKIDPTNPDIVYVGAQGHVWAPNPERGVYKTTDGGKTWKKILFRNDSTGITDLVLDPNDPHTIYAAFWQAGRTPWMLVSGGAGSGIFKSTDGGDHWTELTRNPGLPRGIIGNIGITVSPASSKRVWAIIEADSGGVFRSDDAGATWTRLNEDRNLRQRAWYYTRIFADPKDTSTVYVLNVSFWKSTDGGKTFRTIRPPHGDNHDLWIAPNDPQRMIEGNDGGANVSINGGRTWTEEDYPTAQFYHVVATNDFPYQVCGSQQDNSTVCIKSRAERSIGIRDWDQVGGGESGYIAVHPDSTWIVYAGSYSLLTRFDRHTGFEQDVVPWPDNPMGHSAEDLKYRFQWTFPIVIPPLQPNVVLAGANVIFKTTDGGQSWTQISPDLTKHDPATLGASGGPITKDQTSVEYYATVFTIAPSPVDSQVIWAGSDDGLIHVTTDGGGHWQNVTPPNLPPWTRISLIDASPHDRGTAWVAANRYQLDDMQPYLFRTTDMGQTWTRIDAGIARDEFTRVVREDPERAGLLFAGTERGVWVSFDAGAHWERMQLNLPPVPVHDLAIKDGDLIAATHGRSFWILDDISPLRQHTASVDTEAAHLYQPRDAYRVNWGGGFGGGGGAGAVGANPPSGAVVYYALREPGHEVVLEFLDAQGKLIKRFTSAQDSAARADSLRRDERRSARHDSLVHAGLSADSIAKIEQRGAQAPQEEQGRRGGGEPRVPNRKGLNQFAWNLRYPDAARFRGMIFWAGGTQGPVALPGSYTVRMLVDGKAVGSKTFRLKADPRSHATPAGLQQQFALLLKIRDTVSAANNAVRTIRNVKYQLAERTGLRGISDAYDAERSASGDSARSREGGRAGRGASRNAAPVDSTSALGKASLALAHALSTVEDSIYQTKNRSSQDPLNFPIRLNNKIAALAGTVASADGAPTAQSTVVFNLLTTQLRVQLDALHTLLTTDLGRVNDLLARAGKTRITPSTAEIGPDSSAPDDDGAAEEMEEENGMR